MGENVSMTRSYYLPSEDIDTIADFQEAFQSENKIVISASQALHMIISKWRTLQESPTVAREPSATYTTRRGRQ